LGETNNFLKEEGGVNFSEDDFFLKEKLGATQEYSKDILNENSPVRKFD
jgi:hypothetical protein